MSLTIERSAHRLALSGEPGSLRVIYDLNATVIEWALGSDTLTDTSSLRHIDLRGVTGTATQLDWMSTNRLLFRGSDQDDRVDASVSSDAILRGYGGNDSLTAGPGDSVVYGHTGDDVIVANWGDDRLYGGAGNDTIHGGVGYDTIMAHSGDDLVVTGGEDFITGRGAQVWLGGGNDIGRSGYADDWFDLGGGNDVFTDEGGDDTVIASGGNDLIDAGLGTGDDVIVFRGNFADYEITRIDDDEWQVRDLTARRDGVDTIRGAEILRFADGDHDLTDGPVTGLTALFQERELYVSGQPNVVSDGEMLIEGSDSLGYLRVWDADGTEVPIIDYEGGTVDYIDISGVTGGIVNGIELRDSYSDKSILGSASADRISIGELGWGTWTQIDSGDGADTVSLGATGEVSHVAVNSGAGDDVVSVGDCHADVALGDGDDSLSALVSSEYSSYRVYSGGAGTDTLLLNIDRALVDGHWDDDVLQLNFGAANTDTYMHLSGFEYVSFNGEVVAVEDIFALA